ncbi:glycosyltransferase family 4 protein [Aeromonas caviae]
MDTYVYQPEPTLAHVRVVMACRLLREKGVYEFVDAAQQVKLKYPQSEFWLVGSPDLENPNTVSQTEIDQWIKQDIITYLGHRTDIPDIFLSSNIVCLPSFYGEGVPKVLIEAAACGRAIITTDNPGCRDAVIAGVTGLCVPIKDSTALANAILKLIDEPELRVKMGSAARKLAENEFDVRSVVNKHMEIYTQLLKSNSDIS